MISRIRPQVNVPPAVEAVILRALARFPNDRYSSTSEFAEALESAARPRPITQPVRAATQPSQAQTPVPVAAFDSGLRPTPNLNTPAWPANSQPPTSPAAHSYSTPRTAPAPILTTHPQRLVEIFKSKSTKRFIIVLLGIYVALVLSRFTFLGRTLWRSVPIMRIVLIVLVLGLLVQWVRARLFTNRTS